ncbi:MAG: hypothetical protein OHK005_13010 [Candidatus Methylacidiphilales bacterium]
MNLHFLNPSKNVKIEVTCTHCGHVQKEYSVLEKTTCQACGQVFWLKPKTPRRRPPRPKVEKRSIVCHVCGENLLVPKDALSWQCHGCSTYLDVSSHEITDEYSARIQTYGDVFVRPSGHLTSAKIEAGSLHVAGRVAARVLCHHEIRAEGKASLLAGAKASHLHVSERAELRANHILEVREAKILGTLHAHYLIVTGHLHLGPRGVLTANRLQFRSLCAELGSSVRAKANTFSSGT